MLNSVLSFVGWGVSLTRPVLESISSLGRVGSLNYTPRAGICLVVREMGNFSYTPCPGICLVARRRSFSHTPRAAVCLVVKHVRSFSHTQFWNLSCRWLEVEYLVLARTSVCLV